MDSKPFPENDGTDGTMSNGPMGRGNAHSIRMVLRRLEFATAFGKSTHPKIGLTPREMVEQASNAINQKTPGIQAFLSEVENMAELERSAVLKQQLGPVAYWTLKRFIEEADQVLGTLTHKDLLPYAAEFPLPHLVFQLLSRRELPRGVWVEWPGGPGKNPYRLEGIRTAPHHVAPEVLFGLWVIGGAQPDELPLGCRVGYWTPIPMKIAWFPPKFILQALRWLTTFIAFKEANLNFQERAELFRSNGVFVDGEHVLLPGKSHRALIELFLLLYEQLAKTHLKQLDSEEEAPPLSAETLAKLMGTTPETIEKQMQDLKKRLVARLPGKKKGDPTEILELIARSRKPRQAQNRNLEFGGDASTCPPDKESVDKQSQNFLAHLFKPEPQSPSGYGFRLINQAIYYLDAHPDGTAMGLALKEFPGLSDFL